MKSKGLPIKYSVGDTFLDDDNDEITIVFVAEELDSDGEQAYLAKMHYTDEDGQEKFWFDMLTNRHIVQLKRRR
jgi:hypothetical protein